MHSKSMIPTPGLAITFRRLDIRVPNKKAGTQEEWECQQKPQPPHTPRIPSHWWKAIPDKEWPKYAQVPQQQPPHEDEEKKEASTPEDEDANIQDQPKANKDTRPRAGGHQVRPGQVKRNRIRNVKPTALRAENMVAARGMLERVVR